MLGFVNLGIGLGCADWLEGFSFGHWAAYFRGVLGLGGVLTAGEVGEGDSFCHLPYRLKVFPCKEVVFKACFEDDVGVDGIVLVAPFRAGSVNDDVVAMLAACKVLCGTGLPVVLFAPFLPYGRSGDELIERKLDADGGVCSSSGCSFGFSSGGSAMIDLLNLYGVRAVVTYDAHSPVFASLLDADFFELSMMPSFVEDALLLFPRDSMVFVLPDEGAALRWGGAFADLGLPLVVLNKSRGDGGSVVGFSAGLLGDDAMSEGGVADGKGKFDIGVAICGKVCVLMDDMVSSGGTLFAAASFLYSFGAANVAAYATHPMFVNCADSARFDDLGCAGKVSVCVSSSSPFGGVPWLCNFRAGVKVLPLCLPRS